jgi:electron transfer flavoprotein alpha subunit
LKVLVCAENASQLGTLIGLAKEIGGGEVDCMWLNTKSAAPPLEVQHLFVFESPLVLMPEDVAAALSELVASQGHELVVLPSTRNGREISPRLAAKLKAGYVDSVVGIDRRGSDILFKRVSLGGAAVERLRIRTSVKIISVSLQAKAEEAHAAQPNARYDHVPIRPADLRKTIVEEKERELGAGITGAEKIVAVGRGLKKKEDLSLIDELAKTLGAAVGCTRPLTEDLKWCPVDAQIGLSGCTIRPRLYLGVGISGQIQHIVGMRDSEVIVAINNDKTAPIFQHADYGIVGDLYLIVPEIMRQLKSN